MAGALIAETWQNGDGTENYKCRAWVNFNGTGTVAIRASGNVSSITDGGTGNYGINFTTSLQDTNYVGVGSGTATVTGLITHRFAVSSISAATLLVTELVSGVATSVDSANCYCAVVR